MLWFAAVAALTCVRGLSAARAVLGKRVLVSGLSHLEQMAAVKAARQATGKWYVAVVNNSVTLPGLEKRRLCVVERLETLSDELDTIMADLDKVRSPEAGPILCLGCRAWNDDHGALALRAAQSHVDKYELAKPLARRPTKWVPENATVAMHFELDGDFRDDAWDVSEVAVVDGLVDDKLRAALLKMLGSRGEPPSKQFWREGALADVPGKTGVSWGLRAQTIERLLSDEPPKALLELQSRLCAWLEAANDAPVVVSRLPEAALGDEIAAIIANAPVASDTFGYHVDADPSLLPPSPFVDFFGTYVNRSPDKPRFVSALVYLAPDWPDEFGAPTAFLDPPTEQKFAVAPRPGRLVLLDQDVQHAVQAPNPAAGDLPRYSLVLKLILHARPPLTSRGDHDGQRLVNIVPPVPYDDTRPSWEQPGPVAFGSARFRHAGLGPDLVQ